MPLMETIFVQKSNDNITILFILMLNPGQGRTHKPTLGRGKGRGDILNNFRIVIQRPGSDHKSLVQKPAPNIHILHRECSLWLII